MSVQVAPPFVENWNVAEIALAGEIAVMKCSCDDGVNMDGLPVIVLQSCVCADGVNVDGLPVTADQSTDPIGGVAHVPSARMNNDADPFGCA